MGLAAQSSHYGSVFSPAFDLILNGRFRWICALWSGCIRKQWRLQQNTPACCRQETLLCWRGDQCLSWVCGFTVGPLGALLIFFFFFFNSWVAGALDSAWRAVDNYLAFNKPKELRENFWKEWGPTEYLSEKDDEELVDLNRKLWDEYLGFTVREPRLTSSRKESTHQ